MNQVVTDLTIDARGAEQGSAVYVRAMNAAQAAVDKVIDREQAVQQAIEQSTAVMTRSAGSITSVQRQWDRLVASVDPVAKAQMSAANAIERATLVADAAVKKLGVSQESAARIVALANQQQQASLTALAAKYDPLIAAQQRYTQSLAEIAAAEKLGVLSASAAIDARLNQTSAYNAQVSAIDSAPAARKAYAEGLVANATVNPSASRAADIAAYGAELDALRAKYNPVYAASKQYEAELTDLNKAMEVGAISEQEHGAALEAMNARYTQAATASMALAKATGHGTSALALNRIQMMEATHVTREFVSMVAMGVSPMQAFTMEAGRIATFFSVGDGGALGTLKKMTSGATSWLAGLAGAFAGPEGLAVGGIAALAAGVATYAITSREKISDLNEVLKEHETIIKSLKDAYGEAAAGVTAYAKEGRQSFGPETVQNEAELRLAYADAAQKATQGLLAGGNLAGGSQMGPTVNSAYKDFGAAIDYLRNTIARGQPDILGFRKMVTERWNLDPNNAELTKEAAALQKLTDAAAKAALALPGAQAAIAALGLHGGHPDLGEAAAREKYNTQNAETLYNLRTAQAASLGAIGARSPAELAAAARQRVLAEPINGNESPEVRQYRADSAAALAYAQAQHALDEAQQQRARSLDHVIAAEQLSLSLVGKSVAETEAMKMQFQLVSQLEEEAARNHTKVNQAEIETIKQKAAEYGRLAAAEQAASRIHDMQLSVQLAQAELSLVGQSAEVHDRVIAQLQAEQEIRKLGIDANGKQAQQIRQLTAEQAAYNTELQRSKAAFDEVKNVGESTIDSIENSLLNGGKDWKSTLLDIGKTIAKSIVDLDFTNPLKNKLYGDNLPTLSDVGGIGGFFKTLFGGGPAKAGLTERGATPLNPMWVKSADSGIPGLPGLPGSNGPSAANPLGDLLKGYRPGDVTSLPLGANDNVSLYGKAIQSIESGGNYSALGPLTASGDRAYGAYQVMGANIGPWTKQALGTAMTPDQFLASPSAQDSVFNKIFGGYVSKFGADGAAQAWFGGPGSVGRGGVSDILGTTGAQYVNRFNDALQQATGTTGNFGNLLGGVGDKALTTLGDAASNATQGLGKLGSSLMNFFPSAPSAGPGSFLKNAFNAINPIGWLQQANLVATSSQAAGLLSSGAVGLFANGTPPAGAPPGWAWVGERGPELMRFSGGEHVIPSHVSMQVARGFATGTPGYDSFAMPKAHLARAAAANHNAPDMAGLAAAIGKHIQLNFKNINLFDPSVVGDYLRTEEGERTFMNIARRNGILAA